ncbi:MAG: hypothetical protein A3J76_02485 [Candidatus Moranbacteria bacterium RBG_13_45_13]|nr:MAG: hypothetical protein A3J76_02485 [Candidatus Moranbacteria bacterium RBG_13_45_13]
MKKNKKKIASFVSLLFLSSGLFFPSASRAYSFPVPYGSLIIDSGQMLSMSREIMAEAENRYGFSRDDWIRAKRKTTAPRVEIFFDNTNPKPGEKVTVHAVPEFFKNDPQNLYYTWYLIHTTNGSIQSATNTVRDGKIEASRIMARGDYDPDLDGQNYNDPGGDPDKDGWPAVDPNSYDEDTTAAPMGGADGVGGLPEETVEAYSSAAEWCDSLGGHSWTNCSLYDGTANRPLNIYYTPRSSQSNHYCNLCKDYFSGSGASSYASSQSNRNTCCYNQITGLDCVDEFSNPIKCPYDENTDYCGVTLNTLYDSCYDSFREANKSTLQTCLNSEYNSCLTDWNTVHENPGSTGLSSLDEEDTTRVSRCYKRNFGTNYSAGIFRENELSGSATAEESGLDYSVPCKHKWISADGYKSGSGRFPTGEEDYWKSDPTDPDTDGDGFVDEADVIGLGQQDFTWTYREGDRVGVVVEGTSMLPTDEKTAYYKIMWGYLDVCDETKHGLMEDDSCEDSGDDGYGYLATKSPNEKGEEKIKVSLSFSPDNPVADPSDENADNINADGKILDADQVTVISSLDNTDSNPGNLYYTWQISRGNLEEDNWKEIPDIEDNFSVSTPSSGAGLSQFSFSPKKDALGGDDDIVYFKVTLTVSQASDMKSGRGRSSVIIPYNKNGIKITLHKVDIVDGKATIGDEVCDEGLYASLCPAVKGQMLAAKVSGGKYKSGNTDFSWKANGNPLYPPADASSMFDGWNSTSAFFPITKQEQEIEEISVTASPKDKLQPVTGARLITVVHPAVFIKSADTSTAWPTTYFTEDEKDPGFYEKKESADMFDTLTGNRVSFYLDFVPYYLLGSDPDTIISWELNGNSVTDPSFLENNPDFEYVNLENDGRTITFPASYNEGTYYNLSVKLKKFWSDEEKNILYSAWGVVPETLEGENSVSVSTTLNPEFAGEEISLGKPKQILAAIGNNLSHYFMYLLRLALTMAVMFFASSVLYGLTRRLSPDYEKE